MALFLDPEPLAELQRLYAASDRATSRLADRVDVWLDKLEGDPGTADVRKHRLRPPGLWAILIAVDDGADWALLWDLDGGDVVIRYLGPASFA